MPAHASASSPDNINPDNEQQQGEEQEQEHHQQQQRQDLSELSPPLQNGHPTDQEQQHHQNGQHQELEEEEEEEVDKKEGAEVQEEEEDDDEVKEEEGEEEGGGGGGGGGGKEESDGTQSSSSSSSENEEKPEFVFVELLDIRKDVQCPICLGIIKKTRTVMECLHRFCRECIDKSMRMGNNECPACRTHCASRRSLRDDPNYDALIAALYPDIDKYEEEELAFHEEERTRNKQIQASIAQIIQRQSEALVKRRTLGKESTFATRPQRTQRPISRRRRNSRGSDFQGYEDIEDENDDNMGKDSSSTDDRSTEVRQRRRKRQRTSQPSSSAVNSEGGCAENDLDSNRENRGLSPGLAWNTEMLAWGRGGTRSHTRHGNPSGCNNKNSRNTRLSKLVEYLRGLDEKNDELDIHLKLITLDKHSAPTLKQPYLCCRPSLSIKHLCEYVAHQTTLQAEEVEILLVKGKHQSDENFPTKHPQIPMDDELQILKGQETVAGLKASCSSSRDHLILAYRQKELIKS
ncbi:PREDICTED: putative E3 ubiquitin-protein ligase RING1a [Populus euphratica]|uniref:E3 ubiquitin-protein ligase RING1a n=1 Tax=Populus euphratica TaxID=75702 RepID=A0AAJ6Y9R0_POPEU|nr:PREDICTED: putative E3 ubiquitin-protein ligase RING1a [Populus euphratica]